MEGNDENIEIFKDDEGKITVVFLGVDTSKLLDISSLESETKIAMQDGRLFTIPAVGRVTFTDDMIMLIPSKEKEIVSLTSFRITYA